MPLSRREYRQKALHCLSRAYGMKNPEQRADMIHLAQMWMSLSVPMPRIPGAYEFFAQKPDHKGGNSRH